MASSGQRAVWKMLLLRRKQGTAQCRWPQPPPPAHTELP